MPDDAPLIQLHEVARTYDLGEVQVNALRPTTLDIQRGEFVALIGPSGSGKSTLMNTLGCLDRPTGGSYLLDGQEIVDMSRDQRARIRNQQIGFVFQSFNLLNRTSALENVEVPLLYARSVSASERRRRAEEELIRVGLGDRLDHTTSQLSGGQQQRVAVARALAPKPAFILADEPTANLDSKSTANLLDLMAELNRREKVTFIFSTHDQRVIERARRVVTLVDGMVDTDEAREG